MKKLLFISAVVMAVISCNDKSANTSATAGGMDTTMNNESQESKEEHNKQVALNSAKAFDGETNIDEVLAGIDKDAVDYGTGEMPPVKGADSIKKWMQTWLNAVPDYKGSDLVAVADGDQVMVYGIWTGTWKNNFMGMNATNKSFKAGDVDIFKFNDAGKIIEHRNVLPMSEVSRQIGMKMPSQ